MCLSVEGEKKAKQKKIIINKNKLFVQTMFSLITKLINLERVEPNVDAVLIMYTNLGGRGGVKLFKLVTVLHLCYIQCTV